MLNNNSSSDNALSLNDVLYPEIQPYNTFRLQVSELHNIYVEEVGNPEGLPVLFLHGGPGGGLTEVYRRYFNPQKYRVILFDQRGAGQSTPAAELRENTTWDLVSDIEKIRTQLNISQWHVFGGSWGSTLSLCYAIEHPEAVKSLILRGIFMCRPEEIRWFYQEGAHRIFPDAWENYVRIIPEEERGDFVSAYYRRLTSEDKLGQKEAAKAWSVWEASTSKLFQDEKMIQHHDEDNFSLTFARIECHYFINNIFTDSPQFILNHVSKIQNIPTEIVQGRYDIVCPTESAWTLHKSLPQSRLHIIPDAGHSVTEVGIAKKLVEIMDHL